MRGFCLRVLCILLMFSGRALLGRVFCSFLGRRELVANLFGQISVTGLAIDVTPVLFCPYGEFVCCLWGADIGTAALFVQCNRKLGFTRIPCAGGSGKIAVFDLIEDMLPKNGVSTLGRHVEYALL